jgi:recombination protein RecA
MVKEKKEPKKDAENKHDKALTSALNEIKERFGEGSIMKLSETSKVNVDAISTGSIAMDLALGVGGMLNKRT